MSTKLSEVPVNKTVKILNIDKNCSSKTRKRLLEMGLIKGEDIFIKKFAPLKDPIEIEVKGYNLSLRKNEADFILVE